MTERWYDKTAQQTAQLLKTDLRTGISEKEAAVRLRRSGYNTIYPASRGSFFSYLKHIFTDFISILLLVTAIIAALFDDSATATAVIILLAVNYAAAIYSYVRAHRVLESMGHSALPTAKVMRSGKLFLVRQEQLVPGDLIFLSVGDIVPADARLVECDGLCALETALTGEPASAKKKADFVEFRDIAPVKQQNMLFATTIVTKGRGFAIVTATGDDTLVSALDRAPTIVTHDKLKIHEALKKYCSVWSLVMICVIFALTMLDILIGIGSSRTLYDSFLTGLTLAVSAMSEFYLAFGIIIIGCGVFNASRSVSGVPTGASIRNSCKLETMKDLTALVVPKEGVFSIHDMKLESCFVNGGRTSPGERKFTFNAGPLLKYAVVSTGRYGGKRMIADNLRFSAVDTPEEEAIIRAAKAAKVYNVSLDDEFPLVQHLPASDTNPLETVMTGVFPRLVVIRGEIGSVLARCRYITEYGRVYPLTDEKRKTILLEASVDTRQAFRVIGVAIRSTQLPDLSHLAAVQGEMIFQGFLSLREPMLPGAARNIARCKAAGIRVLMLCDDVADNNRYLAQSIGLTTSPGEIVSARQIADMKEGLFRANLPLYKVYEGLSNAQKSDLIRFLREDGEKVGVLARGLGEMPLVKDCDVGFAQSVPLRRNRRGQEITGRQVQVYTGNERASDRDGCEAVKFVSDVVISTSEKNGRGGFNAIITAVSSSKNIYLNLLRMLRYLLVSQAARFCIVFWSVITGQELLTPVQILFCGLICDFIAVLVIAFEKPANNILSLKEDTEQRLWHPFSRNLPNLAIGVIWAIMAIALPQILNIAGAIADAELLTVSFLGILLTQVVVLIETMREKSVFLTNVTFNVIFVLYLAFLALFILGCRFLAPVGAVFGFVSPGWMGWLSIFLLPLLVMIAFETWKLILLGKQPEAAQEEEAAADPAADAALPLLTSYNPPETIPPEAPPAPQKEEVPLADGLDWDDIFAALGSPVPPKG